MDIDIGKVKVKFGGSNAGHNGIDSIDKNIGKTTPYKNRYWSSKK